MAAGIQQNTSLKTLPGLSSQARQSNTIFLLKWGIHVTAVTSTCGGCLIDHTRFYSTSCVDRTQMDTPFAEYWLRASPQHPRDSFPVRSADQLLSDFCPEMRKSQFTIDPIHLTNQLLHDTAFRQCAKFRTVTLPIFTLQATQGRCQPRIKKIDFRCFHQPSGITAMPGCV